MPHATLQELEAGLDLVRAAPADAGTLELIVRRPAPGERDVLTTAELDERQGLVGDRWAAGGKRPPNLEHQITMMSTRFAALVAGPDPEGWAIAGDQLYVDLDISVANLPPGSRLGIGEAVLEVTAAPHTGCGKFIRRFGVDSMKLVSSPTGRELRLRGVNTRVVVPGAISRGDAVRKL